MALLPMGLGPTTRVSFLHNTRLFWPDSQKMLILDQFSATLSTHFLCFWSMFNSNLTFSFVQQDPKLADARQKSFATLKKAKFSMKSGPH